MLNLSLHLITYVKRDVNMNLSFLVTIIGTGVTVIIFVVTGWMSMSIKVAKLQVKVLELEKNIQLDRSSNEKAINKLEEKIDRLIDKIDKLSK